ncbi:peptidyl-prolyl cis-trans isomerase [Treponema phagedenis]|uniref:Basic membrane protein n=1 Tax=Treponema phagedenis TaxID=162 RepID=A0A0B7GTT8_TREPH|nr:peptidylprolyl isomerase [Treponema phagedenis]NVP24689.1 peptidyl-prolyl cis-trans isomerase [Treponema phagedenis]QEJ95705.1 peptidyl-prolyl cis-trans isomerase [Treponema phagedenis]QEJ98805.1 peptidyl-prolyl cis-trans isomerase [Treponema phagedenis]QEK00529.1 peptidyl-prolyl cis-trans isomerase [Treponema phagedenis]QEK04310.1 peptidyl-prolyl cis-trans isomerase [Treponema phagedenis]
MKKIITAVLFFAVFLGFLTAQSALQPIAQISIQTREPITLGQIKSRVTAIEKELGKKLSTADRRRFMDSFIEERLFAQAAIKEGIRITDSEVNQYFNNILSQQMGKLTTEAEFADYIKETEKISLDQLMKKQNGMTLAEYKAFLKTQLSTQRYVMQKKSAEFQKLKGPTDSQIRSYYELNKQIFFRPDTVKLFLVSIPKGTDPNAAKIKAKGFNDQLKKSGKKAMADIKSKGNTPKAGYSAGEIYLAKTSETAKQLGLSMDALLEIFKMDINTVSEVNETPLDYQNFMVLAKDSAKILTLSDVVEPDNTVTLYETIKNMLMMQIQQKALETAITDLAAELKKPENYKMLVSDAELKKLLAW